MTELVIRYDQQDGTILKWEYTIEDEYDPGENELIADVDHRNLEKMEVDADANPPQLTENPDYDPRSPVEQLDDRVGQEPLKRDAISSETRTTIDDAYTALQTARQDGDTQGQIDALETIVDDLTDIVTGDTLSEIGGE